MSTIRIRPIIKEDNDVIGGLIRKVLKEYGVPAEGTAMADNSVDNMFEAYQGKGSKYYVALENEKIIGGAGIAPLRGSLRPVCELQKMYIDPSGRGRGLGSRLLGLCLEQARIDGYTGCYLETVPAMKEAQQLYLKSGFEYLEEPMGDTGHYACQVRMYKSLNTS